MYKVFKHCFSLTIILTLFTIIGCESDEPTANQKQVLEVYMKNFLMPDTLETYTGKAYFIEVQMTNLQTSTSENIRIEKNSNNFGYEFSEDSGFGLTRRGYLFYDNNLEESLEISFSSPTDSLFHLNYADYYYSSPWKGISGANIEYSVPLNDINNPYSYYLYLGSNQPDSYFYITSISSSRLSGSFKTKLTECCGGNLTYLVEGHFSIPTEELQDVIIDADAEATVIETGSSDDQCKWLLLMDSQYYVPTNLPESFKKNNLNVALKYELNYNYRSCIDIGAFREIVIKDITSR